MTTIVLFYQDLRLADNPAFFAACQAGSVLPIYILRDDNYGWSMGGASQWWLHHALQALDQRLRQLGSQLFIFSGASIFETISTIHQSININAVYWNRRYAPNEIAADTQLKQQLTQLGLTTKRFNGNLLNEPWTILNQQNLPYRVFTPYWKACLRNANPSPPLPEPQAIPSLPITTPLPNQSLDSLKLLPQNPDWSDGLQQRWMPGEKHAIEKWHAFLSNAIQQYDNTRDIPSIAGTSFLSPHLAFGEISPRQIWHDIAAEQALNDNRHIQRYLAEIGWREFSYYQLYHFPHILTASFNPKFDHFTWETNTSNLAAWQQGLTGYPIVDAGMRELWHTGYMHNRVRMIVASFLCKDLLIHWREGAQWFWDTLVDADLASNTASWQWTAGCGADAAPFFRIFNPITQGEKFDADGHYTRQWVPELEKLPKRYLQKPWTAPSAILTKAGITLGKHYPNPIVDHQAARTEALARFKQLQNRA